MFTLVHIFYHDDRAAASCDLKSHFERNRADCCGLRALAHVAARSKWRARQIKRALPRC